MTIRVHYYQPRDGIDVCKNCGAVRNRDAVGPRWCPGKPPAIETRSECVVPPPGWRCTRAAGHDGPCAAERESEAAKITRAKIEELRRLDREATQGEWRPGTVERDAIFVEATHQERMGPERVLLRMNHHFGGHERDAALIAAMRNAFPRLLDAAEAQAHRLSWDEVERAAEEQDPGHLLRVNADLRKRLDEAQRKASEVPGLSATLDEVRGERDRLRALLAECADVLPSLEHFGRYTSSERDARELRERIEAELGCGKAVVAHETPDGDSR